jgi:hypothetical protein
MQYSKKPLVAILSGLTKINSDVVCELAKAVSCFICSLNSIPE